MNARGMLWGVGVVVASWVGGACGPAEFVDEETPLVQLTQTQDSPEAEAAPACGHEPGYTYVLRDPAQCAAAFFTCPVGKTAFFNDCGCGCRPQ